MKQQKIPKRDIWPVRYRAYRHKYGRLSAFWHGVVLGELACHIYIKSVHHDDAELIQHLIKVDLVGMEFHWEEPKR